MKTIYIKVEVPNKTAIPNAHALLSPHFGYCKASIVDIPTNDEINTLFPMPENPRPYQKQTTTMKRNAAKKIIKQIEKQ